MRASAAGLREKREICGRKGARDGSSVGARERERERKRSAAERKRKRGADSMEQREEGYGRHSETVERGTDERTDGRTDEWTGRAGERSEGERERKRRLGGAAARRPAANCQTTPAVPQAVLRPRRRRPPP